METTTKFYRCLLQVFICYSRKMNFWIDQHFQVKFAKVKHAPFFHTWSQYFKNQSIKLFWIKQLMIQYTIYHRHKRPPNSLPPSHQNHNLWKSWLLKVIKFLLRTFDNYSDLYLKLLSYLSHKYLLSRWMLLAMNLLLKKMETKDVDRSTARDDERWTQYYFTSVNTSLT